jgi:uncharacterized protein (TIGR03000 family)
VGPRVGVPIPAGRVGGVYLGAPATVYRGGSLYGGYAGGLYRGGLYSPYYRGIRSYAYGSLGYSPLYRPYYAYRLGSYGYFLPSYGGLRYTPYPVVIVASRPSYSYSLPIVGDPEPETTPPADNAVHLQLTVPENSEVIFGGAKTTQTGPVREYVSPPLTPGTPYTYRITVRYTGADGKVVTDTRALRVQANDWFSVDFTRPPPAESQPVPAPFQPMAPGDGSAAK